MIPDDLLDLLRCPATHQRLLPASPDQLARLNQEITAGRLRNAAGEPVTDPLDAALIQADGTKAYPVRDGIPMLLADESVTFS